MEDKGRPSWFRNSIVKHRALERDFQLVQGQSIALPGSRIVY